MVNYFEIGKCLVKNFSISEGCTSSVKLNKKGIQQLSEKNPELGKTLTELTEGVDNPIIEIAQKAQNNYGVAGFKIRSGNTVLSKGAYSVSDSGVEKVHIEKDGVITTLSKEKGVMHRTDREISSISDFKKVDDVPNVVKSHEELVSDFIREYSHGGAGITGMDVKNFWVKNDLMELSPQMFKNVQELADSARQKGFKIPYDKQKEFIELPLPMPDGKMHQCKIFPSYADGKIKMRIFLDGDIPSDKFNTTQDIAVIGQSKLFGGTAFEMKPNTQEIRELAGCYNSFHEHEDLVVRLITDFKMAEAIRKNWTLENAKNFISDYVIDCEHFHKRHGRVHSVLEPNLKYPDVERHPYSRFSND